MEQYMEFNQDRGRQILRDNPNTKARFVLSVYMQKIEPNTGRVNENVRNYRLTTNNIEIFEATDLQTVLQNAKRKIIQLFDSMETSGSG